MGMTDEWVDFIRGGEQMSDVKGIVLGGRRMIRSTYHTDTYSSDQKGGGGMHHRYSVDGRAEGKLPAVVPRYIEVAFQQGPIRENGVNGCQNEDLIAIVIDRLTCAQAGPFPCRENKVALESLERALSVLEERTALRKAQGVEGQNKAHMSSDRTDVEMKEHKERLADLKVGTPAKAEDK